MSHLIRVFEVPPPDGQYCFGGKPTVFVEVDWFRDSMAFAAWFREEDADPLDYSITTERGRKFLTGYIARKNYYRHGRAYLVLHAQVSFTIGYKAERRPNAEGAA